jgi:lysophospholipase L1-like esterase
MVVTADDDLVKRHYLALGDSVTFGFIVQAGWEYYNPTNFVGFPDYIAAALKLSTSNAACPGETTGSFLSSDAPDNGCRSFRRGGPLRPGLPLHVSYPVTMTQLDYAISFLKSHPKTRLVTIGLGADDVFLLQAACQNVSSCVTEGLPTVLENVRVNLHTILSDLRSTGFRGRIVVVNYYSTDYTDHDLTAITSALNEALAAATEDADAVVADVFTAFYTATASRGGSPCGVGLLNASPQNQFLCDIHPSQSGHALIAQTVEQAVATAGEGRR